MRTDSICSSPTNSDIPGHRNILIVGDVGVGKSSLINLIADGELAATSDGAKSCTFQSKGYPVTLRGVEFVLHDTAGQHEAKGGMKDIEYLNAVHQAYSLISRLEQSGGISLLVYCMRFGRVTIAMQQTYNLFVEVFCNRQVPVVIVVTHLERYGCMEEWWKKHEKDINDYELKSDGHACITTIRGLEDTHLKNYEQSRMAIEKLLLEHSGRPPWKDERISWVKRLMGHMRNWLSPRHVKHIDGAGLRKKLINRCGFSPDDAKLLAKKMEELRRDVPKQDKSPFNKNFGPGRSSSVTLPVVSYTSSSES